MSFMTPILITPSVILGLRGRRERGAGDGGERQACFERHRRLPWLMCSFSFVAGRGQTPRYSCSLSSLARVPGSFGSCRRPAVLHHVVAVGDGRGEAEVLLDQQDREALLLQRADGLADLLDDDGREPSVGSSSSSSRAPVRRMRAIASICCSPPDSLVPWLRALLEVGEQLVDLVERQPPGLTTGGSSRFSSTSRLAKMPRSSGQKAMPSRAISFDGSPIVSRPRSGPSRCACRRCP
jgi:hypothetical protein